MAEKGKEKVTMMRLLVDLECDKCYKKVKKVLCKFPQIREPEFKENSNSVIIKVVCCSPERIMEKLCSKGGGSIKTIEIVELSKLQPPQKKPPESQPPQKKPPESQPPQKKPSEPQQVIPIMPQWQPSMYCGPYYDGYGNGYGMPLTQPYECYWRPVYDSWCGGCPPPPAYRPCHHTRCDYFSEDNPQSCSIM